MIKNLNKNEIIINLMYKTFFKDGFRRLLKIIKMFMQFLFIQGNY